MTARDTIDRMQATIDAQRAKIVQLEQDVAALEAANARLVEETIALRAEARPLLTDAEDEASTARMADAERRRFI